MLPTHTHIMKEETPYHNEVWCRLKHKALRLDYNPSNVSPPSPATGLDQCAIDWAGKDILLILSVFTEEPTFQLGLM